MIRPNRQRPRTRGKSDPIDAHAAAATVLTTDDHPTPKDTTDDVEAIHYLFVARRSAVKARTAEQVQIKSFLVTAPDSIRERLRNATDKALIDGLSRLRPNTADPVLGPIAAALKSIARRHQNLPEEITELEATLAPIVTAPNPALSAAHGVSPILASSGKANWHRLNTAATARQKPPCTASRWSI